MMAVTFTRSYKEGDDWHDSSSFGYDDLLTLSKAADDAHSWIHEQLASKAIAQREKNGATQAA